MTEARKNVRKVNFPARRVWSLKEIDLASLRLFAAAVEEGTMVKTAERENVAISAISRRISDLEWRCGVTLLERHDRGVRATAAGEILLGDIRNVLDELERMILRMEEVRGGLTGRVRVRANMSAVTGRLPELMAEFLEEHPTIEISLDEETSHGILHAVRAGEADVGLVSGTVKGGDLSLIPWLEDELVVVLRGDHHLARRSTIALADLLDEPFVGMQRDSALQCLYRQHAAALGRTLMERAHATSFGSVCKMVSVGLGVAILPASAAGSEFAELGVVTRPLRESWACRPLMLCVRDPQRMSGAARRFVDFLLEHRPAEEAPPLAIAAAG